jgi:hypothetical protein
MVEVRGVMRAAGGEVVKFLELAGLALRTYFFLYAAIWFAQRVLPRMIRGWISTKEMLKATGQNPEANIDLCVDGNGGIFLRQVLDDKGRAGFVQDVTKLNLAKHVRNLEGALAIARAGGILLEGEIGSFNIFRVPGTTEAYYPVTLQIAGNFPLERGRDLTFIVVRCTCLDHVKRGAICKHAGAVLETLRLASEELVARQIMDTAARSSASSSSTRNRSRAPVKKTVEFKKEESAEKGGVLGDVASTEPGPPPEVQTESREQAQSRTTGCVDWAFLRSKAHRKDRETRMTGNNKPSQPEKTSTQVGVEAAVELRRQSEGSELPPPTVDGHFRNMAIWHRLGPEVGRGYGECLEILGAVESQERAKLLISLAGKSSQVRLFGYTFDRGDVVHQLLIAKAMGASVRVVLDESQTLRGGTRDCKQQVGRLLTNGVEVRVLTGQSCAAAYAEAGRSIASHIRGIHHCKSIVVDDYAVIGSCNWTTSSRSNFEMGVLCRIEGYGRVALDTKLDEIWDAASPLEAADLEKETGSHSARRSSETRVRSMGEKR